MKGEFSHPEHLQNIRITVEVEGTLYTSHTYLHTPGSSAEANLPKQTSGKSLPYISL